MIFNILLLRLCLKKITFHLLIKLLAELCNPNIWIVCNRLACNLAALFSIKKNEKNNLNNWRD